MIGRGGFGEVWRADAPGGIKKAVKFVFGDHDDHRAERELKSLERIKGVQHPFLLTLERFEIVEGQLVIVTELADGSLEDIFKQHRERGSCGIPRNALLTYMHDAADALDYLHEMYQLQHLDIKPANLLMVGGHVKVADFGLLKDLRDADCSIIGGLTPIYAPPEVFDGRPSMNSDQYSLAVMYQELLTGVRPFSGRTIAQLATQHVHNAPNLDPLPSSDQPLIARALEKNPDRRFANCREFVRELRDPQRRGATDPLTATTTGALNLTAGMSPNEVEDLPQIDDVQIGADANLHPASQGTPVVAIALGGTGIKCVSQLRRQLADAADCPMALHAIAVDTDHMSLQALRSSEPTKGTPMCQAIHTPLRSAQDYRTRGTDHLRSVSRRWIYNVPRSGKTEGMRPLGRMALVDHGSEVSLAIREAVQSAANLSSDVGSGESPQIFVIASTSGGTASGMYIDVVHVLRDCLDEAGLESTRIVSLLVAPAMRSDPRRPLVLHDTNALLHEIAHFMKPGNGYPGDSGAGWKRIPAARTPLRDAYVISASTEPGMVSPIQSVCEYIWLHGIGASPLLDSARRGRIDDDSTTIETGALRSVGVIQLTGTRTRDQRVLASTAARQLLMQWIGNPAEANEAAETLADRLKRRARIGWNELFEPIAQSFAEDRNSQRAKLMMHLRSLPVDELRDEERCRESLMDFVSRQCQVRETNSILRNIADALQRELSTRLHDRQCDLATAIAAIQILSKGLQEEAEREGRPTDRPPEVAAAAVINTTADKAEVPPRPATQDAPENLIGTLRHATTIGESLIEQFARYYVAEQVAALREMLGRLEDRLGNGAAKVAQAVRSAEKSLRTKTDPWTSLPARTREDIHPILLEVHGRLAHRWLLRLLSDAAASVDPLEMTAKMTSEFETLIGDDGRTPDDSGKKATTSTRRADPTDGNAPSGSLSGDPDISEPATRTLNESMPNRGDSLTLTSELSPVDQSSCKPILIRPPTIEDAINVVRPPLLDCGGRQRLILIVGCDEEKSQYESSLRQAHQGELTVAVIPGCVPTLVHEAQGIKIDDIVSRLDVLTGGHNEISRRLTSRCDVDWAAS